MKRLVRNLVEQFVVHIGEHYCTDCGRRVTRISPRRFEQWKHENAGRSYAQLWCRKAGCPGVLRRPTDPHADRLVAGHRLTELEEMQRLDLHDQVHLVSERHDSDELDRQGAIDLLCEVADIDAALAEFLLFWGNPAASSPSGGERP